MIALTEEQTQSILDGTRRDLVERLLSERRDDLDLLTPVQVCGILNINQKTLDTLRSGIPRVVIVPNSIIRYRAADVSAYISSRMEGSPSQKGAGR